MTEGDGIMKALIQIARNASPYLAVELLLPGGSVIALLLWLFRHRERARLSGMALQRRTMNWLLQREGG